VRLSIVSTLGIVDPIEWKMPPVSIPSAKVRAPAPPPQLFMSTVAKCSPRRSRPARTRQLGIEDQAACASSRKRSEASIILAKALATACWVASVPEIEAMLVAAGGSALLTVPSSETISTTRWAAPTDQGRS
jgi:hypothetical protein